jgi:SHS2 domain-containing protein
MEPFEVIDVSADVGIRAYGETMEDLFTNAATGMYSLITDREGVREQREIIVNTESPSMEGLLVSWLNELIFHFDTYGFVGKKIVTVELSPSPTRSPRGEGSGQSQESAPAYTLTGAVSGEDFDPERHERRLLLKAATYHMLKIEKKDGKWMTEVIFDI